MAPWKARVVALAAADVMDVRSSWEEIERNSALAGEGGTFEARGALIKAGTIGGVVVTQYRILAPTDHRRV